MSESRIHSQTSARVRQAVLRMCQSVGYTSEVSHTLIECLIDSISDAPDGEADATQAMLTLTRRHGIGVFYLDRQCFEANLGRPLTAEQWQRLTPELEGLDEWLSNSGAAESIDYWEQMVLVKAGIETDTS